jgi:NAD(P)-dependent dehydrogenase (short-subunit alcohol dehydrogenase family)
MAIDLDGAVALVTSGANGIGAAAARRPAARGARVVVADVDERGARTWRPPSAAGSPAATCASRRTTRRRSPPLSPRSAASTWPHQRRSAPTSVRLGGPAWDLAAYRRAFGINVDGVFFGVNAALPALQARGRGALVLTSSLAGLTAVPGDPIYAATKHAIVGLARALGPALAADHVAVNALASRTRDQRGMSKPACLADQARWDTRLGSRLGDAHFAHVIAGVFPAAHVNDLASCMLRCLCDHHPSWPWATHLAIKMTKSTARPSGIPRRDGCAAPSGTSPSLRHNPGREAVPQRELHPDLAIHLLAGPAEDPGGLALIFCQRLAHSPVNDGRQRRAWVTLSSQTDGPPA